jgi:hypothetical protein
VHLVLPFATNAVFHFVQQGKNESIGGYQLPVMECLAGED